MATFKEEIIAAIQACAESLPEGTVRRQKALLVALGNVGEKILFRGETRNKGIAYTRPGTLDCILEGLANAIETRQNNPFIELENDTGVTVPAGRVVRVTGKNKFSQVASTNTKGTVGVTLEASDDGEIARVAYAGLVLAELETGLSPSNGDIVAPSITTAGVGRDLPNNDALTVTHAYGTIVDKSMYSSPGNPFAIILVQSRPLNFVGGG